MIASSLILANWHVEYLRARGRGQKALLASDRHDFVVAFHFGRERLSSESSNFVVDAALIVHFRVYPSAAFADQTRIDLSAERAVEMQPLRVFAYCNLRRRGRPTRATVTCAYYIDLYSRIRLNSPELRILLRH
jgi:hypothetical protein